MPAFLINFPYIFFNINVYCVRFTGIRFKEAFPTLEYWVLKNKLYSLKTDGKLLCDVGNIDRTDGLMPSYFGVKKLKGETIFVWRLQDSNFIIFQWVGYVCIFGHDNEEPNINLGPNFCKNFLFWWFWMSVEQISF